MTTYLAARAIPGVEEVCDGVYRRTAVVAGRPGWVELARQPSGQVLVRPTGAAPRARVDAVVNARPPGSAVAQFRADPLLAPLVDACPDLRLPGAWDPFELGVRAIAGQQVSVTGAGTLTGRLARRFGAGVEGAGGTLTHLFPSAVQLAAADLAGAGFTVARAAAITGFARAVADGRVELDPSDPDRLVAELEARPGLGPWTAQYVAARLGAPDAFPASDLGLRRAVARLLGVDSVTPVQLAARAERWRPYRATAAAHLWMCALHAS
jgi:AraC family transcriptional regulator of adaptative response / DNA-3-methyladenine glycosylase II